MNFISGQSGQRDYNEELRYQNEAINKMKKEIEELSSKLRKANINESTTSKRISNLDEEIALINRLIQSLKKEEERAKNKINVLKVDIKKKENELNTMRDRYEERVVNTYLKGRISDLEKVLSSTSWRQAIYRTQYLKVISSIEQKITREIESLLLKINKDKLKLESLLMQSISLIMIQVREVVTILMLKMEAMILRQRMFSLILIL